MRLLNLILAAMAVALMPLKASAQLTLDKADSLTTTAGSPAAVATDSFAANDTLTAVTDSVSLAGDTLVADYTMWQLYETPLLDTAYMANFRELYKPPRKPNIYQLPYSMTGSSPNWHRMWINTAVLSGAFVGTLLVLECLPEDATTWNRAAIQSVPPLKRWYRNIFVRNPEWDHDNAIFNYVLHPYAGAVYFMSARTQGFNFWQSMLYSACISTIGWEFGIEAFMERPSYQDIFITPVVGSVIGELFYKLKRNIVSHDYRLANSKVLGNVVAFLIDPVNEVIDLFRGSHTRGLYDDGTAYGSRRVTSSLMPTLVGGTPGISFTCTF